MLAELLHSAGCSRLLYVDHVDEGGDRLLDAVREVGAEGIVAKRRAGFYRAGPSREWLKTKCSAVGKFIITGFRDLTPGEIEAITVAEVIDDKLLPTGEVQFGVGRRLRDTLEAIRLDPRPGGRRVPVRPVPAVEIKFFGRHRNGNRRWCRWPEHWAERPQPRRRIPYMVPNLG
jgi:bifunctional non-homologous end joining protein LigD